MMKCWENTEFLLLLFLFFLSSPDHISSKDLSTEAVRSHKRVLQQGESVSICSESENTGSCHYIFYSLLPPHPHPRRSQAIIILIKQMSKSLTYGDLADTTVAAACRCGGKVITATAHISVC